MLLKIMGVCKNIELWVEALKKHEIDVLVKQEDEEVQRF